MYALILAAATMALPETRSDDPAYLEERMLEWVEGDWTIAQLELFTDPEGKVLSCRPRKLSGSLKVADRMCRLMERRKIEPARTAGGIATYGVGTMVAAITPDSARSASEMTFPVEDDMVLAVAKLPNDARGRPLAHFPLTLEIDRDGKMTRCESAEARPRPYVDVACREAGKLAFPVRLGNESSAVPYVRSYTVGFEKPRG